MTRPPLFTGDSPVIEADIFVDEEGAPVSASSVTWEFKNPEGKYIVAPVLPASPEEGDIILLSAADGGFQPYDMVQRSGITWTQIGTGDSTLTDNTAILTIPGDLTTIPGFYRGLVRFNVQGITRSAPQNFEVMDPYEVIDPIGGDPASVVVDRTWMKLSDMFDL